MTASDDVRKLTQKVAYFITPKKGGVGEKRIFRRRCVFCGDHSSSMA